MSNILLEMLDLVEDNFNINDKDLGPSIVSAGNFLTSFSKLISTDDDMLVASGIVDNRGKINKQTLKLKKRLERLKVKSNRDIENKVIDITDYIVNQVSNMKNIDISKVYRLADELIFDLTETEDWIDNYKRYITKLKESKLSSIDILTELAKLVLERANQLAPIDTGMLRSSGIVIVYDKYVEVAYTVNYAEFVHENMEALHVFGRAKFLELAAQSVLNNTDIWVQTGVDHSIYIRFSMKDVV